MTSDSRWASDVLVLLACPECGSDVWSSAKRCWLCGHAMDSPFKGHPKGELQERTQKRPQDWYLHLALGVLAAVLVIVTAGVWMQEPVFGILLAVAVFPAVGMTLAWGLIARLAGKPISAAKRLGVFLTSALVTVAMATLTAAIAIIIVVVVVFATIIAMFIALFEACLKMMGGG